MAPIVSAAANIAKRISRRFLRLIRYAKWPSALGQKNDNDPNATLEALERWSGRAILLILAGIIVEIGYLWLFPHSPSDRAWSSTANILIGIGLAAEYIVIGRAIIAGGEADRQSKERVAGAEERAAEANRLSEQERHARAKLESQLKPRTMSREQWDMIHGLRGKLEVVSLVCEADPDAHWFANQFAMAFKSAGIRWIWYRRAPDVHTARILIYDQRAFENPDGPPTQGEPLASIMRSDGSINVVVTNGLPTDVPAPPEIPALIIGGRHILRPSLPRFMFPDETEQNATDVPKST